VELFSRGFVISVWVVCALLAATYLLGWLPLGYDGRPERIGPGRLIVALLFATTGLYLMPGVFGRPLASYLDGFLLTEPSELWRPESGAVDPGGGGARTETASHAEWPRNDWDGALARAAEKRRPVLFDFTGVG
jgi:thiol:disulfide interchange protein DsbD